MTIHYILKLDDHASSLLSQLHNMLKTEIFTDLTLATDEGLSIKVHRPIMCAFSPYLKELFAQHPEESHSTVVLCDVSFVHLKTIVEFIYTGKVTVAHNQLPALLETASSLKIKGLDDYFSSGKHNQQLASPATPLKSNVTLPKTDLESVRSITQMPAQSRPQNCVGYSPPQESDVVCEQELAPSDSFVGRKSNLPLSSKPADFTPAPSTSKRKFSSLMFEEEETSDWKIAKRRLNDVVQENQELVQKPAYVEQEAGLKDPLAFQLLECHKCGRSYKTNSNLKFHFKFACGAAPSFQCSVCDKWFTSKYNLRRHLTDIHGISGPTLLAAHGAGYDFQCNLCSFYGTRKSELRDHIAKQHNKLITNALSLLTSKESKV